MVGFLVLGNQRSNHKIRSNFLTRGWTKIDVSTSPFESTRKASLFHCPGWVPAAWPWPLPWSWRATANRRTLRAPCGATRRWRTDLWGWGVKCLRNMSDLVDFCVLGFDVVVGVTYGRSFCLFLGDSWGFEFFLFKGSFKVFFIWVLVSEIQVFIDTIRRKSFCLLFQKPWWLSNTRT